MIGTATAETVSGSDPVMRSLRVLSSGWAEQRKEHRLGSCKPQLLWILTSRNWVKVPLNYVLIDHRDGLIVFDTGLGPEIAKDPIYISSALGQFLLKRIFDFASRTKTNSTGCWHRSMCRRAICPIKSGCWNRMSLRALGIRWSCTPPSPR